MRFILICFVLLATQSTAAVLIHTAKGQVEIKNKPSKLAVYDVGVLDTLEALGVQTAGVAENLYVDYLSNKNKTIVGSLFVPNLEALNKLQPDLIIVGARSAKHLPSVKKIAQSIDLTLKGDNHFQESLVRLKELGTLFNQSDKVKKLTQELLKLRQQVRDKSKLAGRVLVLLVTGAKISVYGKNSRIGWFSRELGLNMVETNGQDGAHGQPISFEYIAKTNPDWLIVIDRAKAIGNDKIKSAKSVLDNALVHRTHAWKKNQILYLNSADLYIPIGGVQSIKRTMMDLLNGLSH